MCAYQAVRGGVVRLLEWVLIAMVVLITLDVLWGVLTRAFGHQAIYTDELARALLVWISMLGGALAFERKAHLGVDFFVSKMRPEARKTLSVVTQGVTVALAAVAFIAGGIALTQGQWGQKLATMPRLTQGQVYLAIPVAGVFILLFALENLVAIIRTPAAELGAQTQSEG